MIILNRDGTLTWHRPQHSPVDHEDVVEIPNELLLQHDNLIDQVLDVAFNVLGLHSIELRIRETVTSK